MKILRCSEIKTTTIALSLVHSAGTVKYGSRFTWITVDGVDTAHGAKTYTPTPGSYLQFTVQKRIQYFQKRVSPLDGGVNPKLYQNVPENLVLRSIYDKQMRKRSKNKPKR